MNQDLYENAAFYQHVMMAAIAMSEANPLSARCQSIASSWIERFQSEVAAAMLDGQNHKLRQT